MSEAAPLILYEYAGAGSSVAIVTLNRPDRANAMTPEMAEELADTCQRALDDPLVKAIVLTGKGKHFCPGLDAEHAQSLAARIARGEHPAEPYDGNLRRLHRATLAIHHSPKPVIAAVNGAAAAGGLDLALAADYRIATPTGRFCTSYIKLGQAPLNGGGWLLPRVVSPSIAFRMTLSAELVDAESALRIGLADEIVPAEELLARGVALAESVSFAPAPVIAFTKRELRSQGALEDALARAFVAGIGFSRSREFHDASGQMPGNANK